MNPSDISLPKTDTQKCVYCDICIIGKEIFLDHFISKQITKNMPTLMLFSCRYCNGSKQNFFFATIEQVRDFIRFKKIDPMVAYGNSYKRWKDTY